VIPVQLAEEPADFHKDVRIPGLRSIYEKCGLAVPDEYRRTAGRPCQRVSRKQLGPDGLSNFVPVTRPEDIPAHELDPSHWQKAIPWLMTSYRRICAYSCFRIHASETPSVDHLIPKSRAWDKVYEWSNFRLAKLLFNARKSNIPNAIDPFEVQPYWFALEFTFGQVVPGPAAEGDAALQERIKNTVNELLGLNEMALCNARMSDYDDYQKKQVGWERLCRESPFVAIEIERQGKRRRDDTQDLVSGV
jgi:hypothetical protein